MVPFRESFRLPHMYTALHPRSVRRSFMIRSECKRGVTAWTVVMPGYLIVASAWDSALDASLSYAR